MVGSLLNSVFVKIEEILYFGGLKPKLKTRSVQFQFVGDE